MPNAGFVSTRNAIAKKISHESNSRLSSEDIIMTVGAAGALNVILHSILNPKEEVIVFKPFFPEYKFYVDNHQGISVFCDYDENFEPFFSLNEHNKIILNIQNKDLPLSAKKQAILISNSELRDKIKSGSFRQTEGWILDFDDFKVLLGKKELQVRLKKIIKLTNKLNKKDLKNKFLDLRYPKGFVIKNLWFQFLI